METEVIRELRSYHPLILPILHSHAWELGLRSVVSALSFSTSLFTPFAMATETDSNFTPQTPVLSPRPYLHLDWGHLGNLGTWKPCPTPKVRTHSFFIQMFLEKVLGAWPRVPSLSLMEFTCTHSLIIQTEHTPIRCWKY